MYKPETCVTLSAILVTLSAIQRRVLTSRGPGGLITLLNLEISRRGAEIRQRNRDNLRRFRTKQKIRSLLYPRGRDDAA